MLLDSNEVQEETVVLNTFILMEQRLAMRREIGDPKYTTKYIFRDFIVGSSAEAERLFSLANFVMAQHRRRMTPELFEAVVFLKVKSDYWDAETVSIALTDIRRRRED